MVFIDARGEIGSVSGLMRATDISSDLPHADVTTLLVNRKRQSTADFSD